MKTKIILITTLCLFSTLALGYDVHIKNNTNFTVSGKIAYNDGGLPICGDDYYKVSPKSTFTKQTGICLLQLITANANGIEGIPYRSSGTGYEHFSIIMDGDKVKVIHP